MFRRKAIKNKKVNNLRANSRYCTVILEKTECIIEILKLDDRGNAIGEPLRDKWSTGSFIEETGVRLFEELIRRIRILADKCGPIRKILISMPGTILDYSTVKTSSRIGIKKKLKHVTLFLNN